MDKKRDTFFLSNKKQRGYKEDSEDKETNNFSKKRQDNFNKNRPIAETETTENVDKKPFDKKAYRLKKYSKKYKLDQWEEQRKKKLLQNYYKDLKNDPLAGSYTAKAFDEDTTDSNTVGRFVRHPDLIEKEAPQSQNGGNAKNPYNKAKERFNKIKEEKVQKHQQAAKAKEEKQQKLQEYKKKKQERFKKLSKKTKKGQPVMTGRLEMLLEKIQKS